MSHFQSYIRQCISGIFTQIHEKQTFDAFEQKCSVPRYNTRIKCVFVTCTYLLHLLTLVPQMTVAQLAVIVPQIYVPLALLAPQRVLAVEKRSCYCK